MLNTKKLLTKMLSKMNYNTLYNSSKVSSGSLTLSDDYTNYDFLVISYMVNVDEWSCTFDCAKIAADPSHLYSSYIVLQDGSTLRRSACKFSVTNSKTLSVSNAGDNVNFTAGIKKIVGVKLPSWGGVLRNFIYVNLRPLLRKAVVVC